MRTVTRRVVPALAALAAFLVAGCLLAGTVAAHALPQTSTPADGSTFSIPPTAVTITFGETPDPRLSSIRVLDASGRTVSTGVASPVSDDPLTLRVPLAALGPGVYTVAWRTVSVVDGHTASGSFAFAVGPVGSAAVPALAGAAAPNTSPSPPDALAILGRWLLFSGLIVLTGLAAFGAVVEPLGPIARRRVLPLAWLGAAAGTLLVAAAELSDAGVDIRDAFDTSLGAGIMQRTMPLLFAGIGVLALVRRAPDSTSIGALGLGGGAALIADVLLSHAAGGGDAVMAVAVQALHVLAVTMWLGGLTGLVLAARGAPRPATARAAARYSRIATAGIAIVAATGVARAIEEVGTLDRLVSTDFGRLVIAKTILLGGLAGLGALNHFRSVPAAGRDLGVLRRVGSAELLVGATIILLSAVLVNTAPPVQVAASGGARIGAPGTSPAPGATASATTPTPTAAQTPAPLTADGADFGTSVRLHLAVSPGIPGSNTFTVSVVDYDTRQPVAATGVTLRFTPPRSDVGSSRLDLAPTGTGVFAATGTNLSLVGAWEITATVANGAASAEVPLALRVDAPNASPSP